MRKINHHLTDEILMSYSAGSLSEAFSLVVATHVSMCDECRAHLDAYDAVGGSVLDDCGEASVGQASLEATLALISDGDDRTPARRTKADAVFPAPLAEYVAGDLDSVKWKRVGGGVRQAILPTSKGATVRLLHIPAGTAVPDHGHSGAEMTLVLKGAFRDEFDRFGPGDVEVANEDLHHTPVAEEGEDCICLAATDAPLRFNAILPRIAQRFVRI